MNSATDITLTDGKVCVLQTETDGVPAGHLVRFWRNAHGRPRVLEDLGDSLPVNLHPPIEWGQGFADSRGITLVWFPGNAMYTMSVRTRKPSEYFQGLRQLSTRQTKSGRWVLVVSK